MESLVTYWAQQRRQYDTQFTLYEQILRQSKMSIVPSQQRFGARNDTCFSLSQMMDAGYQVPDAQSAFTTKDTIEDNLIAKQLVEALESIATERQIEAAYNLMLGQATNADYCSLRGLRKKFKDMTWDQIMDKLLANNKKEEVK